MGILWRAPKFISKFASSESGVITADFRKVVGQADGHCVRPLSRPVQCPMGNSQCPAPGTDSSSRRAGSSMEGSACRLERDSVGPADRCSLG